MPNVKLYNMSAAEVGTLELNEDLFGMDYNEALIHQAVVTRLANERQGTKSTLTRAEVRGGGDRRARAAQGRVPSVLRSGRKAAWYSHPSPGISRKK